MDFVEQFLLNSILYAVLYFIYARYGHQLGIKNDVVANQQAAIPNNKNSQSYMKATVLEGRVNDIERQLKGLHQGDQRVAELERQVRGLQYNNKNIQPMNNNQINDDTSRAVEQLQIEISFIQDQLRNSNTQQQQNELASKAQFCLLEDKLSKNEQTTNGRLTKIEDRLLNPINNKNIQPQQPQHQSPQYQQPQHQSPQQPYTPQPQVYIVQLTSYYNNLRMQDRQLPQALSKLEQLFDISYRSRTVESQYREFVQAEQDANQLIKEYGGSQQFNNQILKHLKGFQRVRGDGNCFYTAFVYQYLKIIQNQYTSQQLTTLLEMIRQLPFQVTIKNRFIMPREYLQSLPLEFINQLLSFKSIQDLTAAMANPQGNFYGLSILFIRNLAYKLYMENPEAQQHVQAVQANFEADLLEWEQECNLNEIIIALLAKFLQLHIVTYYLDNLREQFNINEYGDKSHPTIALILRPGHYQIAIQRN